MTAANPMDPTRLHSGYVAWLVGLTVLLVVGDLLDLSPWVRGTLLGGWTLVEIIGAFIRRGMGDTWSEINGALLRSHPEFVPVVLGWMVWYLWQWVEIFPWGEPVEAWVPVPELGLVALAVGVFLWWPVHLAVLWWRARHG